MPDQTNDQAFENELEDQAAFEIDTPWGRLPATVTRSWAFLTLASADKQVYLELLHHRHGTRKVAFPSIPVLSKLTRVHEKSIPRSIRRLMGRNMIKSRQVGRRGHNEYVLVNPAKFQQEPGRNGPS
jgi:hypothetical protein